MNPVLAMLLRILGIGALVAGGLAVVVAAIVAVVLLGPLIFWIAWNVLNFGHAVGLPELGFWGILLATLFLVAGAVAFNVADVYAAVGAFSLIVGATVFAVRHPALLRQPI